MSLLSANLKAFIAITKTSTVHGAAKEIGLTQTGVTQRIRALENELSTTLFIRSRRGMLLTEEGQSLLRYCQAVQDIEGCRLAQIIGTAQPRVTIVGPTSIISSRVVCQTQSVLEKFKNLLLTLRVNDLENRVEELRSGAAHFAILSPDQVTREMDSKLLKSEKYVLVGSSSWKGRRLQDILKTERIIDFDETDKMSFDYLKHYKLRDQARPDRLFVNNNEALIEMFRRGAGYGVLTTEVARPYLERNEIMTLNSGQMLENRLALAWYPRPQMPEYFRAIVSAVR